MESYAGVLNIDKDYLYMLFDPETIEDKELPVLEHDYCHAARLGNSLTLARCDNDKWHAVRVGTKKEYRTGPYPVFLDDVCFWSDFEKENLVIFKNGNKIGVRATENEQYASFFSFKETLFDFGAYGVYETFANKKITDKRVNDIVPVHNAVYVAKENNIFLRPTILEKGLLLNLPHFDKTLEPYNLCPFGQTLYFKSGLDLYAFGDSPEGRSGVGQFKYYFPDKKLEVLLDVDKWAPWKKDKFGSYPMDFADSESAWVPITARELEQLKLLEYKRPK